MARLDAPDAADRHASSTPRRPSRARSSTSRLLRAVHRRRVRRRPVRRLRSRPSTRPPRRSSPRSPRPDRADVDRAVTAARKALHDGLVASCRGRERGKYLFRIARIIQERARELAVLESLDNGKPIRESRDVDVPLVAAHFFYYAGLGRQARLRRARAATPQPLGVAGQVIPWNFPLLMLAWKIAPALACRQHRGAQAGRDHPADGAAVRRDLPAGRPAPGRGQHRHRRRRRPARARRARRRRQGRLHRLHRGRQARSPGRSPAPARS